MNSLIIKFLNNTHNIMKLMHNYNKKISIKLIFSNNNKFNNIIYNGKRTKSYLKQVNKYKKIKILFQINKI